MNKNDVFYLCSLLELLSRKTNLEKKEIIRILGDKQIFHLYKVASVNHALPIEQVSDEIIEDYDLPVANKKILSSPSIWDMGHVYQRLIEDVSNSSNWFEKLIEVYNSWICKYIDDYKKPIYWQPRSYLRECYLENDIL